MSETTTNVRIRADLVPDLKKRAEDDRHASLNGLVNEILRGFLQGESAGGTPVGLMAVADEQLGAAVAGQTIWFVVASEVLSGNPMTGGALFGPTGGFAFIGAITRFTPTMVEVTFRGGSQGLASTGFVSVVIARSALKAWWKVEPSESDVAEAHFITEVLGRPEDPFSCAVRREALLALGVGGVESYFLSGDDSVALETVRMKESIGNHPVVRRELFPVDAQSRRPFSKETVGPPRGASVAYRTLADEVSPEATPWILVGLVMTLPGGGQLHHYRIMGSPNLIPSEDPAGTPIPIAAGVEYKLDALRAYPWVVAPNFAELELTLPPGAQLLDGRIHQDGIPIEVFAICVDVTWDISR